MKLRPWMKVITITCLFLLLLTLPLLSACGGGTTTEVEEEETAVEEVDEFEIVKDAVEEFLTSPAQHIMASDLHMRIVEDDAPYIVSLRPAEDYAKGHIPGAVNIKFSELTTLPEDEEILLYCKSGQDASFGAAVLGVLGYDVNNLKYGISGWVSDPDANAAQFVPEKHQSDYQTETEANAGSTYSYPKLDNTTSTDSDTIVEAAAKKVSPKYILATDLNMKIAEGEDMTILDIRKAEYYAAGHIAGAINCAIGDIPDNLKKLDPNAPVYVYCDTGHWAAEAAALLQMLGYDAWSLKYGICSWSSDEAVNNNLCYDAASVPNYDVEK